MVVWILTNWSLVHYLLCCIESIIWRDMMTKTKLTEYEAYTITNTATLLCLISTLLLVSMMYILYTFPLKALENIGIEIVPMDIYMAMIFMCLIVWLTSGKIIDYVFNTYFIAANKFMNGDLEL